jgi:hypothetical protein
MRNLWELLIGNRRQHIVMDLLKEFLGSASVNMAITQQYRTLHFSACLLLTSHGNSKEGPRDLHIPQ